MLAYLVKRIVQAIAVMLVISLVGFAIQENLGDPLRELVGQSVSEEVRNELREELGLNDSFVQQYGRFLGKALQGDLGTSYFFSNNRLLMSYLKSCQRRLNWSSARHLSL